VGTCSPQAITNRTSSLPTDWKPIDKEEEEGSLKWLNEHRQSTASFRHQSTKERAEFVANQMELEEAVVGIPGHRAFNVYLDRHRNMISDQTQLYGPLREGSWEEHLMQLPEGS
jgi:hypothetical protein